MGDRWVTPRQGTASVVAFSIDVRVEPEILAILRGIFDDLANPEKWEQLDGLTITPEEAAAIGKVLLDSYEANL